MQVQINNRCHDVEEEEAPTMCTQLSVHFQAEERRIFSIDGGHEESAQSLWHELMVTNLQGQLSQLLTNIGENKLID